MTSPTRQPAQYCHKHEQGFEQGAQCVQCWRDARATQVAKPSSAIVAPPDASPQQLAFVEWLNAYRAERV